MGGCRVSEHTEGGHQIEAWAVNVAGMSAAGVERWRAERRGDERASKRGRRRAQRWRGREVREKQEKESDTRKVNCARRHVISKVLERSRDHVELPRQLIALFTSSLLFSPAIFPPLFALVAHTFLTHDTSPTRSMSRPVPLSTSFTCAEPSARQCSHSRPSTVYQVGRHAPRRPRLTLVPVSWLPVPSLAYC